MKFYNRVKELKKLKEIEKLARKQAQMTVITGRRRVGKTELISQFIKKRDDCFYFFVEKKRTKTILEEWTEILSQRFSFLSTPFSNWPEFWHFIFEISKKERITIVFDEFQNFKFIDPSNFSTFWFRYIFRYRSQIEIKKIERLNNFIKKDISNLKGFVFEEMAREWILHQDRKENFIFSYR